MLMDRLLWIIVICVSTIIELIFLKICIEQFNEQKKNKLIIHISFIMNIVLVAFMNFIELNYNIKLLISVAVSFLIYIYNYKTTLFNALILTLICWMGIVGIEVISLNIILIINPEIIISKLLKNNMFRLELVLINNLLLLLILAIMKRLKSDKKIERMQCIYLVIPVIANLLSIVLIFILALECKDNIYSQKTRILLVSIMLFISNLAYIKITLDISKSNKLKLENVLIKEKIDIQYQRYLDLQENQFKIRKLYHDMNNHILCINKLYKNNESANGYIDNVKNELNCLKSEISTKNMILDIIIHDKKKICNQNNIHFDVDINFSKCEFIEMVDICSIFSNIIDNAIEACIKVNNKTKFIRLKGIIVNKIFVLKCENSKKNEIKFKKREIITNKKDSFLHGIGIKSIKNCVQKYDGEVSIDFSNNIFIMKVYIPLI